MPATGDDISNEHRASLKNEHEHLIALYKHYSTIRFALLTVFFTANGALLASQMVYVSHHSALGAVVSFSIIIFFGIYHEVIVVSQDAFHQRIFEIQDKLGYKAFKNREILRNLRFGIGIARTIVSFRFASRGVFVIFAFLWVIILLWGY